jgi:hypothetical protein
LCLHASLALPFYKCVISFCVIIRAIWELNIISLRPWFIWN